MKRIIILILLIYYSISYAINIVQLEYFIDTDPGLGNGTNIPITPDSEITSNFSLDLSGEEKGLHFIYTRVKDEAGKWSLSNMRPVFKNGVTGTLTNIVKVEYFIDTDPGLGNGTNIPITPDSEITSNFSLDLSGEEKGLHFIYTRVKDEAGKWSLSNMRPVFKNGVTGTLTNIVKVEYFIDTDPGLGNGTNIPITPDSEITSNFSLDLSGEEKGLHFIYTRVKDEAGKWSLSNMRPVFKNGVTGTLTNIVKVEYFIDTDPGLGNGTNIPITPDSEITSNFSLDLSGEEKGLHFIYTRVKDENEKWSFSNVRPVYKNGENIIADIEEIQCYFTGSDADPSEVFSYTNFTGGSNIEEFITQNMRHLTEGEDYCLHICAINENGSSSFEYLFPFNLDFSPQNVTLSIENGEMTIDWDEVPGAATYEVYSSNDLSTPQSSWLSEQTGIIGTLWNTQINADKKFYYLKSSSDNQRIRRRAYIRGK